MSLIFDIHLEGVSWCLSCSETLVQWSLFPEAWVKGENAMTRHQINHMYLFVWIICPPNGGWLSSGWSYSHNVFTDHYFCCFHWWALLLGQLCKGMWVVILLAIVIYISLTSMVKKQSRMVFWAYYNHVVSVLVIKKEKKKLIFPLLPQLFTIHKVPWVNGEHNAKSPSPMPVYENLHWQVVCTSRNANILKTACSALRVLKQSLPRAKLNLIYVRNSTLLLHRYSPESYLYPFRSTEPKI